MLFSTTRVSQPVVTHSKQPLFKGPAANHPITINKILITQEWVRGVTQNFYFFQKG